MDDTEDYLPVDPKPRRAKVAARDKLAAKAAEDVVPSEDESDSPTDSCASGDRDPLDGDEDGGGGDAKEGSDVKGYLPMPKVRKMVAASTPGSAAAAKLVKQNKEARDQGLLSLRASDWTDLKRETAERIKTTNSERLQPLLTRHTEAQEKGQGGTAMSRARELEAEIQDVQREPQHADIVHVLCLEVAAKVKGSPD
ncbi:hypothetical protein ABBQ38_007998 [Trebouxia sp. C0009 RCD-2024]